jgi:hypothetical protein
MSKRKILTDKELFELFRTDKQTYEVEFKRKSDRIQTIIYVICLSFTSIGVLLSLLSLLTQR